MNTLYTNHSEIYEMMYQTFINYDEEYDYYSSVLRKYDANTVVELGCGTGSLAKRLCANGFNYTGLDLNKTMLEIASEKNPGVKFIIGNMKDFVLEEKSQACIIAGRSISYLMTNKEVMETFNTIHKNLSPGGILCFDNIDAGKFIPFIKDGKQVIHHAEFGGRKFRRESYWSVNGNENWSFNWESVYMEEDQQGNLQKITEDNSTVRCFTKDDLHLFLTLCNFEVRETIDRASYAFDTCVIVAQKK